MSLPEYCKQCSWLFDKMGACGPPQSLFFFSLVSFIPYIIIILFVALSFLGKSQRQFKMAVLLLSAYIIGDRILKNLIQSPRPIQACKKTYGFPSSHMVVMVSYAVALWNNCKKGQKLFLMVLVILQGFARVNLKYHTWQQVAGGTAFAIIYTLLFNEIYSRIQKSKIFHNFCQYFGIRKKEINKKN